MPERRKYAKAWWVAVAGAVGLAGAVGAALPAAAAESGDASVVRTAEGPVRGTVTGDHRVFEGIPYAAPPVGSLRWTSPQPVSPWTRTRDATRPGNACAQTAGFLGDAPSEAEDCLYLNVTTPRHVTGRRLPVMFWIHGGGFYSGAGDLYDARRLATQGDVIVVTPNYRLGVFGLLTHPSLDRGGRPTSGDFGLEDQQAALRWVRRNAAAFGGDPGNVTISGESAGGVSTCTHLTAPGSAGLFRRAIVQSGPCAVTDEWPYHDGEWVVRPRAERARQGASLAAKIGCGDAADVAACLRRLPVSALLNASDGGQGFGPAAGGTVLPVAPATALATGRFAHVPVIQGTTRDEHRLFVAAVESFSGHVTTEADYRGELEDFFGPVKAAKVLAEYPVRRYGSASLALASVWTDYAWACPAGRTDRLLSERVPTYAYEFADENAPWASDTPAPAFPTGAFHASELQYLFDQSEFRGPLSTAQRLLSDRMIGYWTRFARTGDPNGGGAPTWAPTLPGAERVLSLASGSGGIRPVDLAREHRCGFWTSLGH
ncbi:carboxylesterase/lipase family protein [Actinoallomurus sp. NPDC052308]|uniref:carboxylesterase/lipase family protein n=1 Tax=Actinoallomurus sp. NPDC052308 TaxID=3155530 RepID=UPI003427A987